jgi:hypothetical protein
LPWCMETLHHVLLCFALTARAWSFTSSMYSHGRPSCNCLHSKSLTL